MACIWDFLKDNDLPNWIAVSFTAILWPLVLFYWNRRKVNNISNFEVSLRKGYNVIDGVNHSAVDFQFLNNTGSIVYLTNIRIKKCTSLFAVPPDASRDIAENSHELKFVDASGKYIFRQTIIQTDQSVVTTISVAKELQDSFYIHRHTWFEKLFRVRKYFILAYTAMVGDKRYRVETIY